MSSVFGKLLGRFGKLCFYIFCRSHYLCGFFSPASSVSGRVINSA